MNKIISIETLTNPQFIKPIKINYTLEKTPRIWEAVISHDSVAVLLYHTQKKSFIVVKQLRAPVLHTDGKDGFTHELCAGIVDKDTSYAQIAKEEVLEECGFDIPTESLEKVTSFYPSVGVTGAEQTLYYASCDDSMKVNDGGGLADEAIEVVYIPLDGAKKFIFDDSYKKTPGMMMAFYWFFDNKL